MSDDEKKALATEHPNTSTTSLNNNNPPYPINDSTSNSNLPYPTNNNSFPDYNNYNYDTPPNYNNYNTIPNNNYNTTYGKNDNNNYNNENKDNNYFGYNDPGYQVERKKIKKFKMIHKQSYNQIIESKSSCLWNFPSINRSSSWWYRPWFNCWT